MIQRISKTECVALYKIEVHFFDALVDAGLIIVIKEHDEWYLDYEDLHYLERYTNLYYDLDINVAGIEVIARLLQDLKELKAENKKLQQLNLIAQSLHLQKDIEDGMV